MKTKTASIYRCPVTANELSAHAKTECGGEILEGHFSGGKLDYSIHSGVPNFIYPAELDGNDAEFKDKYDKNADIYEVGLEWLFKSFYENQDEVRNSMVDLLDIKPGQRILEVGCGTGKDSIIIAERMKNSGELFMLELSASMLHICRENMKDQKIEKEFVLSNASYLPFPDNYFDCVYHFGGINTFNEKARSIKEFTRVANVGGLVVFGDESVPPWLREKAFGKYLMNANPLYKYEVPLELLPEQARQVSLSWLLGNAFYMVRFVKAEGAPPVDIDLPIPGKGDSLRSRYENKFGAMSC